MSEATTLKFYLAEKVPFTLYAMLAGKLSWVYTITASSFLLSKSPVTINLVEGDPDPEGKRRALCDKLTAVFKGQPLTWTVSLQAQKLFQHPRASSENEFHVTIDSKLDIAESFRCLTGQQSRVSLRARLFENEDRGIYFWKEFRTDEMAMPAPQRGKIFCVDAVRGTDIVHVLESGLANSTGERRDITGVMDLIVIVETQEPIKRLAGPSGEDKMVVNRPVLEEEISCDVVILANNGAEVKCHRSFLAAHSDVFQTMFATDMQEARNRKVKMPDMSEEGVRAFLAYLYHWDVSMAEEYCAVALELMKAGHKYNIRLLEKDMRELLFYKPESWYDVDVAVKLHLFLENLDGEWDSLKKKALMVMKKNAQQLENSPTYKQHFGQDPAAAMRLFEYTLSVSVIP